MIIQVQHIQQLQVEQRKEENNTLFVTESVGIGTTSPSSSLHISAGTSGDADKELVEKAKTLTLPTDFDALLVEAVKELKEENDALKAIVCKDHPEEAICQEE